VPQVLVLADSYGNREDFRLVAVSLDRDEEVLRGYVEEQQVDCTLVFEPGAGWKNSVSARFLVRRIPSLWVVDAGGSVRGVDLSVELAGEALQFLLEGRGRLPQEEAGTGKTGRCSE
jgi:hypothetical protein